MSFLKELFRFLAAKKKVWLVPALLVVVLMIALLIISQSSAVAPFVYSMF